jgi:YD repeat-containing protein
MVRWCESALSGVNHRGKTMKRTFRDAAIIAIAIVIYTFGVVLVRAEPQTRFYDARGNSIGTATPQGQGSVRYYDSRGSSLGTSTTTGNTTTFYGPGGSVTGRATGPSGSRPFGGGARR